MAAAAGVEHWGADQLPILHCSPKTILTLLTRSASIRPQIPLSLFHLVFYYIRISAYISVSINGPDNDVCLIIAELLKVLFSYGDQLIYGDLPETNHTTIIKISHM